MESKDIVGPQCVNGIKYT